MTTAVVLVTVLGLLAVTLSILHRKKFAPAPVVYCVVATVVGFIIIYIAQRDQDASQSEATRVADTAEARYGACVQFNVEQQGDRSSGKQSILALFGFESETELTTPEQQSAYLRYAAAIDAANPFRDCTPEGISVFYTDPPADPADIP